MELATKSNVQVVRAIGELI